MEDICVRVASGRANAGPVGTLGPRWRVSRPWRLWLQVLRWLAPLCLGTTLALASRPSVGALDWLRLQEAARSLGPRGERAASDLRELLERGRVLDESARLALVNGFVNQRLVFADDTVAWGHIDYWASPLEALARGQGDCEDYAIAKYFTLVASGIAVNRLRLVYVRAVLPATEGAPAAVLPHMVLAYYADNDAEPLILDNLVGEIRRASRRVDLTPVFSFNGEGLWTSTGPKSAGDPQVRLSRWRELLAKARAEGFE